MKLLVFEAEALAEYRDAATYYAAESPEVALRFVDLVESLIEGILTEPHVWPLDPTVPSELGVRRRRLDGFPHSVVYLETNTAIHVLALPHGRRKPGYWLNRLPP